MYETSRQSQVSCGRKIGYHTHRHTDTDGTTKRLKQVKVTGPARGGGKRVMAVAAATAAVAVVATAAEEAEEATAWLYSQRRGIGGISMTYFQFCMCVSTMSPTHEAGGLASDSVRARVCLSLCV